MRLTLFAPSYYPKTGGVEKHVRAVAAGLVGRGHQVAIAVRWNEHIPPRQKVDGVVVLRLPRQMTALHLLIWAALHPSLFWRVDAFHSHDIYPRIYNMLLGGKRWVHTFHGYEGYPLDPAAIASRRFVRAEVPICIGVGAFIEKWYGTKCDSLTYGAVDEAERPRKRLASERDMVFIGRLEPDTGFADYLEGFALIAQKHPEVTLTILGDGSLAGWAKEFIAKRRLNAEITGFVADVEAYLATSRVAFVSGYLGIIEAGLYGLPVIAHFGTPLKQDYLEMHPMSSNLFIAHSAESIAAAYEKTLEPEATQKTEALQAWSAQQSWDKIVDMYESMYRKLKGEA